jgi:GNAT superfamily N-acetyltransferase
MAAQSDLSDNDSLVPMSPARSGTVEIRTANAGDAEAVGQLAADLATSFVVSPSSFRLNYAALLSRSDTYLLIAADGHDYLGYLLGFWHLTFYANGPVAWIEEVFVHPCARGCGVGRALMSAFEAWAAIQGCPLVELSTRWAAPFYRALGYDEAARYFRKILNAAPTRPDADATESY